MRVRVLLRLNWLCTGDLKSAEWFEPVSLSPFCAGGGLVVSISQLEPRRSTPAVGLDVSTSRPANS